MFFGQRRWGKSFLDVFFEKEEKCFPLANFPAPCDININFLAIEKWRKKVKGWRIFVPVPIIEFFYMDGREKAGAHFGANAIKIEGVVVEQ